MDENHFKGERFKNITLIDNNFLEVPPLDRLGLILEKKPLIDLDFESDEN